MDIFDASLQNLGDYFETTPSKIVVQGSGYNVAGGYGYENGKLTIVTNNGAMNCYGFATQNKIDLTNFKYIRFSGIDGNPTSSNAFRFDISDEKYISFMNQPPWSRLNTWDERCGNAIRDRGSSSVSQIVVDISDITGAWYFIMGVANTDSESATNTYISKIELLEDITPSGGAGSGYIGNSLLSNKKMVGYNVPTSSAEGTKTESVNDVSASAVSGKPKSGNGFARIKFLRNAWGGEEVPILWVGNSNKMTVQISNNKIVFKLYSGNLLIYSFDAYVGATIIDADNIYVHFLIDSEQELAKPSMIYDNNSVLSYNQEEPTDEEMADIYTWLSAGLPSE